MKSRYFIILLLPIFIISGFLFKNHDVKFEENQISFGFSEEVHTDYKSISKVFDQRYSAFTSIPTKPGYIWLKIDAREINHDYILKISNHILPEIQQFIFAENDLKLVDESGYKVPCRERTYCHQNFLLNLQPNFNFIRIKSFGTLSNLRLKILKKSSFIMKNQKIQMGYGLFYGGCLFFLLLNIFLYQQTREKINLLYIVFTFSFIVTFAFYDGNLGYNLLPSLNLPEYYINRLLINIILLIHLMFFYEFFGLLQSSRLIKSIYKVLFVIQVIQIILCIVLWPDYKQLVNYLTIYIILLQAICLSFILISLLVQAKREVLKSMIIYLPLGVIFITYLSKTSGIIFFTKGLNSLIYSSISISIIILSFLIIEAFVRYKQDAKQRLSEMAKIRNYNNLTLESTINKETETLNFQKELLETKNKELIDSFLYAKRIQNSLLPTEKTVNSVFKNSFLVFKPKQILSTDFYWLTNVSTDNNPDLALFCIGKPDESGIPGTLINAIVLKTIRNSIHSQRLSNTARINNYIQNRLNEVLAKNGVNSETNILVGVYDRTNRKLSFSGNLDFIQIIRKGIPLNALDHATETLEEFNFKFVNKEHTLTLEKGDQIYLSTNGIIDLFSRKGKHFFIQLLMALSVKSKLDQKKSILEELKNLESIKHEDITFLGIKIDE